MNEEKLAELLAERWHNAFEWQYGDCDHGEYTGGPSSGESYKMCEIMSRRISQFLMPHLDEWANALTSDAIQNDIEQSEEIDDLTQELIDARLERDEAVATAKLLRTNYDGLKTALDVARTSRDWWRGKVTGVDMDMVERIRELVNEEVSDSFDGGISCGGYSIKNSGCFAAKLAERVENELPPSEEMKNEDV